LGEIEDKLEEKVGVLPAKGSVRSYAQLLELLAQRQIPKVDSAFLKDHDIASGNEREFIAGLKFLGLTDKEGIAKREMNDLCVVGDKRKENLAKIVRNAYSLLFEIVKIDLEKADPDTLINAFKQDYRMGSITTATEGARIFVFLAQQAGIPLSQQIEQNLSVSHERVKRVSEVAKQPRRKKHERTQFEGTSENMHKPLSDDILARFELKDTGYVDIKDKDTYELAKGYMKLLAKKLQITEKQG
jgi:hypothetical protein